MTTIARLQVAFPGWLRRIWFQPRATRNIILFFSVLLVQQRLWGDSTTGYHWSIFLHRLCCAGAKDPALLAIREQAGGNHLYLHPVNVEAVAWIAERKAALGNLRPRGDLLWPKV